jgi:tetratricopeptide (TPR) repeat protein
MTPDSAAIIEFPATTFSRQELEESVADADAGLRMGRPDLALKIIDLTLQLVHDHPALLYRRAVALNALGRTADALEAYDRTLALGVESAEFEGRIRLARSWLLMELHRFAEAFADSTIAAERLPNAAEALLTHARALGFNNQGDAAIDAYDEIIGRAETLNFENCFFALDHIVRERDAIAQLFLEGGLQ